MAIPDPATLKEIVDQPLVTIEVFTASLTALMGNAQHVKDNYRGSGLFSFYVPGQIRQAMKEQLTRDLKAAGYQLLGIKDVNGYMPPAWYHDFLSADHETPGVTGFPRYAWTHVQVSALPVTE